MQNHTISHICCFRSIFLLVFVVVFNAGFILAQNSFGLLNETRITTGLNGSEVLGKVSKSFTGLKGSPELMQFQLNVSGNESNIGVSFSNNTFGLLSKNVVGLQYIYDLPLSANFKLGLMASTGYAGTKIRHDKAIWVNTASGTELIDYAHDEWLVGTGLRIYSNSFLFGFMINPAPFSQTWEMIDVHLAGRFGKTFKIEPYLTYQIQEAAFDFSDNAFLNKSTIQAGLMGYFQAFVGGLAFDYEKKASVAAGFQFQRISCLYRYVHNIAHTEFSSHEIRLRYDIAWKPMFKI